MTASTIELGLVISPEQLSEALGTPNLLPVAVCQAKVFAAGHVPDSALIEPGQLVSGIKPATGKLPSADRLSALFSSLGLSADTHVVAYDDEGGGWAGRLIWTLDVIGHRNYSYLDGGLIAWINGGHSSQSGPAEVLPGHYTATIDRELIVDMEELMARLDDPATVIWDARSREEYEGRKTTALKNGHIPGAMNLDWLDVMDRGNDLRLKPLQELREQLAGLGIDKDKKVITHCQTHHRSGLTYLAGKALGLDIKAYDGSWSEWGNHPATPVET